MQRRPVTAVDKNIGQKIKTILSKGERVSVLVITSKEYYENFRCTPNTDKQLESLMKADCLSFEAELLESFGSSTNFSLVNRRALETAIMEMKFQKSGMSTDNITKFGKISGANYLVLLQSISSCSNDMRLLDIDSMESLINIETSTTIAIDRSSYRFEPDYSSRKWQLQNGNINGLPIQEDSKSGNVFFTN